MAEQAHETPVQEQQTQVQDYLDFMLREATTPQPEPEREAEAIPEPLPVREEEPVTVQERELTELAGILPPESAEVFLQPDEALETDEEVTPESVEADVEAARAETSEPDAVRIPPQWAETEFPTLLFRVRGMDMAAPMLHLGGIATLDEKGLQPVAGQAPWFIGLMRWNGRTIRVIDTARLLMGEKGEDTAPADDGRRRGYRCVIVLHGTDWGLAVDHPGESRTLQPENIRWRRERGRRPWLAGTLSDNLCSLLDTGAIIERLAPIAPVSRPDGEEAPSLAQNLQDQG